MREIPQSNSGKKGHYSAIHRVAVKERLKDAGNGNGVEFELCKMIKCYNSYRDQRDNVGQVWKPDAPFSKCYTPVIKAYNEDAIERREF